MKLPAIKKLVNSYELDVLVEAKRALFSGEPLPFEVEGEDDGEQMTHLYAAVWVLEDMVKNSTDMLTSLRAYTAMVRRSFE